MSNMQPKYDSLEYASELKEAGFTENQAKVQAKALFRVIDQQLVTKQDIKELETKLSYDIKEIELKIKELELKTAHQMKELESQLVFRLTKIMVLLFSLSIGIIGLLIKFL